MPGTSSRTVRAGASLSMGEELERSLPEFASELEAFLERRAPISSG